MKLDSLLTRSKQGIEPQETESKERKTLFSSDEVELYHEDGKELPIYAAKTSSEKDKLTAVIGDADVNLIQISNGKPVLIMHSKHGAMHGDFSLTTTAAGKILKNIETPLKVTSVKNGDAGIMVVEKIHEHTSVIDLVNNGALSLEAAAFLWLAIEGKVKQCNILVTGNGSNRQELASALSVFIPLNERVAVIGNALHAEHWNEVNLPFDQAVAMASEMKFNRIVGEMLPKHAKNLFALQGTLKGILTMPGNTCAEVITTLRETSGKAANCIDILLSCHEMHGEMKVTEIAEVVNGSAKPLFMFEQGELKRVRLESELEKQGVYRGLAHRAITGELENKKRRLENWDKNGIRSNKEIRLAIKTLQ